MISSLYFRQRVIGAHHLRNQISHAGGTEQLHAVDNFPFKDLDDLDDSCISICLSEEGQVRSCG
jgi:hypothetical protein